LPVQTAYPSFTRSIAVGSSATNLMATSADGITWTGTTVPFTGKIHCVAWNGNYWVAGGEGGTYVLAYSTDGINWTGVTLPTITAIYCLAWVRTTAGVNQWVAGGLTVGGKGWASSTDSIAWTEQTAIFTTATYGLVYANGLLYAVGGNNGGGIASSADLVTWTYTASVRPSNIPFSTAFSIAFNGNSFVVVGSPLNYSNTIAFADFDGTYWQGLNGIFSVKGNDVMYGNGLWVAVGEGISHTIAISQNGYEWTGLGTSIFSIAGTGITWNGERFVATGSGTNTLAYSTDGITWVAAGTSIFSTTTYLGTPGQATKVTSQFVGPPTFPLTDFPRTFYTQTSNAAVALNSRTIQKLPNGTNQAWDARVNSVDGVAGSAYLSFRPATNWTNSMMGLSDAPSTTANYSRINFGVNLNSAGNIDIYESGLYVNSYGTYSLSDRFKILFNGSRVFYYKNSTLLRSVARTSLSSLYMCCSMYTPGAKITDIDFHRMYSLVTSNSNFTTSSFVQSEATGINTDLFPPIYYNSGNLGVSQFQLNLAIAGTLSTGISTSLFTDMFINETRYFSTAAQPGLFDRFNTYNFSFFIPSSITLTSNDRVNFRVRGTKPAGQLYLYGNWVNSNATSTLSTQVINVLANPNGMEYLEFYHSSAETGFQTSELQLYISPVSTLSTNYTNSNIGLEVNRGFLRWSSTLNGQTIQNKFNDITTRTITYTNALYNTSDPRMKRDIETVDPTTLVSSFSSLTLRRYAFIGPFLSTFLLEDSHQLGLLTREVEQVLPGLVHEAPFHHLGLDTIQTLDRAQLKFLHLGVTQSLIQRISTLEGRLAGLRCLYPFVEGAENV
jgi:hypothetical protein